MRSRSAERTGRASTEVDSVSASPISDASVGPAARSTQEPTLRTIGRFELKAVLGRGGFGIVYRAYDPHLERYVALKIPTLGPNQKTKITRFLSEAKAAARLKHANIVTTFESGQVDNKYYIASEFIEGSLLSVVIRKGRPSIRDSVLMVQKLAEALGYAHSQGIVHRDVKPHNVIIDTNGEPQLMDFGLAKRLDDSSNMTTDGSLLGTPAYMSPEQARGEMSVVGPASDQYSLGVVLYHLLTGTTPCEGSPHLVIAEVAKGGLYSVRDVNAAVDSDIAAVCQKAMSPEICNRYPTCGDFAEDLANVLARRPVTARPLSWIQRARRVVAINPLVTWFISLSAALLFIAVAFAFKVAQLQRSQSAAGQSHAAESIISPAGTFLPTELPKTAGSIRDASAAESPVPQGGVQSERVAGTASVHSAKGILRPEILFEDFEGDTYGGWTASGTAFSGGPYCPIDDTADHGVRVINSVLNGRRLADSCFGNTLPPSVELTGTLISPPFTIERNYIHFWLAGGQRGSCQAVLRVDGKVVRSADSGYESWVLRPCVWGVAEFQNQTATFEVIDNSAGISGGRICVDSIVFSDVDQTAAAAERESDELRRLSIEWNGRKYYFAPSKANYREAKVQAAQVGGHLLCVESVEEAMFVSQQSRDMVWLGIEHRGNEWVGPGGLYTHGPWDNDVQRVYPARAVLRNDGKWQTIDARMSTAHAYVIEFGPIEPAPSVYSVTPRTYVVRNAAENRLAAEMILDKQGQVVIAGESYLTRVASKSELPDEDFEVKEVYLFRGTAFAAEESEVFRGLEGIERFEVRECDSSVLSILEFMPNLREFLVDGGEYKWIALRHLKSSETLRKVNFRNVAISSRQMQPVFEVAALEEFGVTGMKVDAGLADLLLQHRSSLFNLWLNGASGLGPKGIEKLGQLEQLQTLVLWGAGVSDAQLPAIGQLKELRYLQLGQNKGIQGKNPCKPGWVDRAD